MDMEFAQEEIFGPVSPLYRFETEAEAIAVANDTSVGLLAGGGVADGECVVAGAEVDLLNSIHSLAAVLLMAQLPGVTDAEIVKAISCRWRR